uniref:Uncharacterized protein n=1 Tax=Trichogramma kaykai TaxID=54128 RepID=A0ABD2X4Q4_9HYME
MENVRAYRHVICLFVVKQAAAPAIGQRQRQRQTRPEPRPRLRHRRLGHIARWHVAAIAEQFAAAVASSTDVAHRLAGRHRAHSHALAQLPLRSEPQLPFRADAEFQVSRHRIPLRAAQSAAQQPSSRRLRRHIQTDRDESLPSRWTARRSRLEITGSTGAGPAAASVRARDASSPSAPTTGREHLAAVGYADAALVRRRPVLGRALAAPGGHESQRLGGQRKRSSARGRAVAAHALVEGQSALEFDAGDEIDLDATSAAASASVHDHDDVLGTDEQSEATTDPPSFLTGVIRTRLQRDQAGRERRAAREIIAIGSSFCNSKAPLDCMIERCGL